MSKKDKQIKEKFNFTKLIGFLVVGCFCVFFINFIYESATILLDKTEETIDSTKRWCENCNTFHDINDETIDVEDYTSDIVVYSQAGTSTGSASVLNGVTVAAS